MKPSDEYQRGYAAGMADVLANLPAGPAPLDRDQLLLNVMEAAGEVIAEVDRAVEAARDEGRARPDISGNSAARWALRVALDAFEAKR